MSEEKEADCKNCPLSNVHTRMNDAHRLWHQAMDSYFDPESFRINVQNCIQALRTVTWLLQNKKAEIPDFDTWYGGWQEKMRADLIMRWLIEARNKIEKQGDLESHSELHVTIIASHADEYPIAKVQAGLFETLGEILKRVPVFVLKHQVLEHGVLKLQRRWVETNLPNNELLEALSYVYGQLSLLIDDAHKQLGLPVSELVQVEHDEKLTFDRKGNKGRLPCMVANEGHRTLLISLKTRQPLTLVKKRIYKDEALGKKAVERYKTEEIIEKIRSAKNLRELADAYFEKARAIFLTDGYLVPFMCFVKGSKIIDLMPFGATDKSTKYLLMRRFADEVQKNGADAVMFATELWFAPVNDKNPFSSLEDSPDKEERLGIFVCSENSEDFCLYADVIRNEDKISLSETKEMAQVETFLFKAIQEMWSKKKQSRI